MSLKLKKVGKKKILISFKKKDGTIVVFSAVKTFIKDDPESK